MAARSMFPAISPDGNLSRYLDQIRAFPMLEPNEEYMLAKAWKEKGDVAAAHQLVTSHLRLVAKIAMGYRGYGLPVADLISEGNLGMMHAVKKFEPEKGFRLATYAMWWIKAAIQEYILRSWSLVKIGTTAGQKKLFFNLRRIKGQRQAIDDGDLKPEQVTQIATQLDGSGAGVVSMDQGMAGDNVGVLLRGTKREDVERGQVLCKPGSIKPHTKFTAEIYCLSKDEGGRHTPFFNGYRPQFYFRTTDVTGAVELPEGTEMVMPGDNVSITATLIAPIAMEEGLRFAIREGGRTVGSGVVVKVVE